jgi:hypothetical protein
LSKAQRCRNRAGSIPNKFRAPLRKQEMRDRDFIRGVFAPAWAD